MDNKFDTVNRELLAPLKMLLKMPNGVPDLHDIERLRNTEMPAKMKIQLPGIDKIKTEDLLIPGPANAPDVKVKIFRPPIQSGVLPALLWIHGGGYVLGDADQDTPLAKCLALKGKCIVVSVNYRLAPENPFPAALEDCYAALEWLASGAGGVGVDATRIAVGGASAGGGLAACLSLLARDRAKVGIRFQMLIYPMIDDGNTQPASDTLPDAFLWNRESNLIGWRSYLGCEPGSAGVSSYASACRATDLACLPPAYIAVGGIDLFMKESVTYAQRLLEAGVAVELHVYPGAYHAFDMISPDVDISRRFTEDFIGALSLALHEKPH